MSSAVVFAYHNVGCRCLNVLLAHGVDVKLVVTHQDNPKETIWFDSVAELAGLHGIPIITPDNPNTSEIVAQIRALEPDFFFSFYYREMLKRELLEIPKRGALNMIQGKIMKSHSNENLQMILKFSSNFVTF